MGITVTWRKKNGLAAYAATMGDAADTLVDSIAKLVQKDARSRIVENDQIETGAMRASIYKSTPKNDDYEDCAGEAEALAQSRSIISDFNPNAQTIIVDKVSITKKHQAVVGSAVHYAIYQHEGFTMPWNGHDVIGTFFLESAAMSVFAKESEWDIRGFK